MGTPEPLTLAFAGPGEVTETNVNDLLLDLIGTEGTDGEGYPLLSRDVSLLFPITDSHLSDGLKVVLDWTETVDLPFAAVTDGNAGRTAKKFLKAADDTTETDDVTSHIVAALQAATGEVHLVLLWGEEGDEDTEGLLAAALDAGVSVKDLTAGLDDISFDDGQEPEETIKPAEPTPEPEPAASDDSPPWDTSEDEGTPAVLEGHKAPEAPAEPVVVDEATGEEKPARRRGRPRADAPVEEPTTPYWEAPDGVLVKAGKGRPRRGHTRVLLTEAQIAAAREEGRLDEPDTEIVEDIAPTSGPVVQESTPVDKPVDKPAEPTYERVTLTHPAATPDLENRFGFHAATSVTIPLHEAVRRLQLEFARQIDSLVPAGREKALALTHLEETGFWANAGIARALAPLAGSQEGK